ncbi:hypothetical protein [Streptomyces naphthomycinicus]|uniref:hypothetical protein n=1 Tax=Streptomyces naphthomycinicus TaxID=2872625 RepID=UPI001CECCB0C|nr:hypothetical protein [Streptomyces sp. TML10]
MSSGFALPTIHTVAPAVHFAPPPPPVDPAALPHTGMLHLHDAAGQASAHLADAAGHAAHQAADAALQVLGSLSGVLLVGRAALLGTRLLATAAVRAAEEQRCLERQQQLAATAAEQWQAAAFATVRINARRHALLARVARSAAGGGPPGPPPNPSVPPPLAPVGEELGALRQELARAEKALCRAEERQAAWEQRRLAARLRLDEDQDDDWQSALRANRQSALARFAAERTADAEARQLPRQPADRRAATALDPQEVRRTGAEILGGLDPYAAAETAELAAQAVRHAVRRAAADPRRARIHLGEAHKFVRDANKQARETREAQERVALHHDFLVYETPEGAEDLAPAPDAVALLRRTLDDGAPLTSGERELVERRVEERLHALEAIYVRQQCATAVAELADRFGGEAGAGRPEGQEIRIDWTPEGWEGGHWLRATLVDGRLRVATMYRGGPGERTPRQRALDDARCAETQERLTQFEEITGLLGLGLEFTLERTEGALPGVLGEDALVVDDLFGQAGRADQDDRAAGPRRDVPGEAPRYRTVDGEGRR